MLRLDASYKVLFEYNRARRPTPPGDLLASRRLTFGWTLPQPISPILRAICLQWRGTRTTGGASALSTPTLRVGPT
ncbi:hypothetical protein MT418_008181 [Batrachochytrium dendrobatidis]